MEELSTLWQEMILSALRARAATPDQYTTRCFSLAGLAVEITFVGLDLCERLTRSLKHLEVPKFEDTAARLRIDLWDGALTQVDRPFGDLRDTVPDTSPFEGYILSGSISDSFIGHQTPQSATIIDLVRGHAVGWVSSFDQLSRREIGKPLQIILFHWYSVQNLLTVHSGVVARGQSGVLIGGAGGSGKSTTSLLCARAGFSYLGDDYVGLPAPRNGEQQAFSLYDSLWLEPEHSANFSVLSSHGMEGQNGGDCKIPFVIGEVFPDRIAISCTVRVILLPRVAHRPISKLRPATPAEALLRLAPSTLLQLPFIQPAAALERLASLVRHVPSFWLDLGTDFDTIPVLVDQALQESISQRAS